MKIEISIGEIVDKLSILELKKINIQDDKKLINVKKEYEYLFTIVFENLKIEKKHYDELFLVNKKLWNLEEKIREKDYLKEFDDQFIEYSKSIYQTNDDRFNIKKKINIKYNSKLVEEKSHTKTI